MNEDLKILALVAAVIYGFGVIGTLFIETNYTSKEAAIKGFFIALLWPPYLVVRTIYRIGKAWADLPDTEK